MFITVNKNLQAVSTLDSTRINSFQYQYKCTLDAMSKPKYMAALKFSI